MPTVDVTPPPHRVLLETPRVDRDGKPRLMFKEAFTGDDVLPKNISRNDLVVPTYRNDLVFVPSLEDISMWFDWGRNNKFDYMLICQNFSFYSGFPVFASVGKFWRMHQDITRASYSRRVVESYCLFMDKQIQLNLNVAWNTPVWAQHMHSIGH